MPGGVQYSPELFEKILERMRAGETLSEICRDPKMPTRANVLRWTAKDDDLRSAYARAREDQADAVAENAYAIGQDRDREPNDRRVAFDAGRWLAGKLRPRVWGEKLQVDVDVSASVVSDLDRLRQAAIRGEAVNPALPAPGQAEE